MFTQFKIDWMSNIRGDLLSGIVVALALIPEAIAFSLIAGVDPKVGLYASFCICVIVAFSGGRAGMISGATGAMALLMVTLVREHGLEYLLAASLLTGVIQIVIGYLKLADLMRLVSRSVITGFVNALAILILLAQLPELTQVSWHVYAMTALGLAIIYLFPMIPKVGKLIPSPLVCIVLLTVIVIYSEMDIRTVGDMGNLPDSLPVFLWPDVPLTLETLWIILPYALALAVVGLLESMMTASIVDDLTDTYSDKSRECKGQGIANIGASLMGGMAGCAMIGQSVINIKSGGLGRLSSLAAGIFLLIMVLFLDSWLKLIPMAALVAVMIMVAVSTFSWQSIADLKHHPLPTNIVMLSTMFVVVITHNLAIGVLVGVVLASLFYANKSRNILAVRDEVIVEGEHVTHRVHGQIFFASADHFIGLFEFKKVTDAITLDLSDAYFWDITAVAALDKVIFKFRKLGVIVKVIGMNDPSEKLIRKFAIYDNPERQKQLSVSH
ncbi:SulP family inorganic anion transporter [Shewanella eurypsychrophilus]|uniref:SulP family inorganic anion transporter n=1 Tax=Shewanella eurypsychrophilus TaxID=2593656 RepID=A0ABX6V3F0_9GAMM|nr:MULTISPECIES: SulP family inorganic anion transporter [Shewanella]QFU21872.1 STAS domain-containing protein [Shewanella sp. YLB-09]QPG57161.1 SulP family inorganic anion transporter [Shewanella eurypsychrophilus]